MTTLETRTTRVSFFGRFADSGTRRDVLPSAFRVSLESPRAQSVYKLDGSFVFIDLEPQLAPYTITAQGPEYRTRQFDALLPSPSAESLRRDGEDELYLSITNVDAPQSRVEFPLIPFLPTIDAAAEVIGPGGFSATLQEPLEGEDVGFAVLSSVAGLANGDVLRIVRSDRLLLRPGPYHVFPQPATVLSARFLDSTTVGEPVAGVVMTIDRINGVATSTVTIGGLVLHQVPIAGDAVVLGPASSIETLSNSRGDALLDLPAHLAIISLRLQVSHPDYVPVTQTVAIAAGGGTRWIVPLVPV